MHSDAASWRKQYETALNDAMKDKLPNRPGRRFDRKTYPRRPKSNQFKKKKTKAQKSLSQSKTSTIAPAPNGSNAAH